MSAPEAVDILVQTDNPEHLDRTVQQLGAAAVIGGPNDFARVEGCYVVRCFGGCEGYIEFAIKNQGYGTVVRRLETLL